VLFDAAHETQIPHEDKSFKFLLNTETAAMCSLMLLTKLQFHKKITHLNFIEYRNPCGVLFDVAHETQIPHEDNSFQIFYLTSEQL